MADNEEDRDQSVTRNQSTHILLRGRRANRIPTDPHLLLPIVSLETLFPGRGSVYGYLGLQWQNLDRCYGQRHMARKVVTISRPHLGPLSNVLFIFKTF